MNLSQSRSLIALALVVAAFAGGGCLWSQRSGLGVLASARSEGLEADSVYFEFEVGFDGLEEGSPAEAFALQAHGAADSRAKRSFVVIELATMEMEVRTLDGKTYIRFFGDTWMESEGNDTGFEDLLEGLDPFLVLDQLGGGDVERLGKGESHGKTVEKYRVSISIDDLEDNPFAELMPPDTEAVFELWIDSDGRPAHLGYDFSIPPGSDLGLGNSETVTFWLTMDLFDYGKPVTVEPPPADKIGAMPDFGSLGGLGDPFEGADCYGDRLEDCFAPDPATDAMASRPDACRSAEPLVCLVPVGKVRPDVVKAIVDFHRDTNHLEVVVLPSIPLASADVRMADSQITAEQVYRKLQASYGVGNDSTSTFIGITAIDIVPENGQYGWMFGQRTGSGPYGNRHGVFSYFRMVNVKPYDGRPITDDLIHLRVAKYAARYTTILFLHVPVGNDPNFLNYRDMYGFSDLDSMGTNWPAVSAATCSASNDLICIIPDKIYEDDDFLPDLEKVVKRLAAEGYPVELFPSTGTGFKPSWPDWGAEFVEDIANVYGFMPERGPGISVIGVTDDSFVNGPGIEPHFEFYHPARRIAVVSAGDAGGTVGTTPHQERLYRMLLRAILVEHYGLDLNSDASSLLYAGWVRPSDLDGRTIPAVPAR